MKIILNLILLLFAVNISKAQSDTLEINLNYAAVNQSLLASPHEINVGIGQSSKSESIVYLPYKDGSLKAFKLIEYDILPAALRKEIKTYYGQMLDDPTVDCRLTLANGEIRVNFNGPEGTIALERNVRSSSTNAYWLYKVEAILPTCGVDEHQHKNGRIAADHAVMFNTHGTQLRTYRLALIITTGFYTAGGGTDLTVNAHITTIVNNLNGIYEKEIAVRFMLVSPTTPVSTNVFSIYDTSIDLTNANTELNARYGSANFDVGHLLLPSGGGRAQLGSVCGSSKGRALSGVSSASDVFVFAHELGHQFNAGHTFNGNGSGNCGPDNRMNDDAYEPGSGNTIMSYSDICSPSFYNIVGGGLLYFHTHSQESMITFIKSSSGSCGVVTNTGNAIPVVAALTGFTIPRNTPFTLTGSATDADSDPLTYTWEQYNLAAVADSGRLGHTANSLGTSAVNSPTAPLFRTVQSSNPTRNFPNLTYVLNNANNPPDNIGEDLPNVARTLNFRLTARDNKAGGGGVAFQQVAVVISNNDPFEVTTGNGPTLWFQGESKTITWNVNGTTAAPISCANVKISTSIDGGVNFTTLIASTPNNGTHPFTVPNSPTSQFRIKIEAIGNIFYDINNVNITISNGACIPEASTIINTTTLIANAGTPGLLLNLKSRGSQILTYSSSITSNSPASNLVFKNTNNQCASPYSNAPKHNLLSFIAENTGNTTFTFANTGTLLGKNFNLYNNPYNPANQCSNWINSSAIETSPGGDINLPNTFTHNLVSGNIYQLRISGFSTNDEGTFTVNFSGNNIYNLLPSVNSPYDYTYLIYNTNNNLIVGFDKETNLVSYPVGSYRIYGLSFAGGANLNSYINTSFTAFQTTLNNSTFCGQLSTNFKNITINPCPSIPNAPTASGVTIQAGNQATINATGCAGTYQWYEAASGGTVILSGNVFTSPVLNQTRSYFVSCLNVCESPRTQVVVTVISYCSISLNCLLGDFITNVSLSRSGNKIINQNSICGASGYTFYNSSTVNIIKEETLSISVTKNAQDPNGLAVWIDFNRDGDFLDAGEMILQRSSNTTATQSGSFSIPASANLGLTRMRVKIDYLGNTSNPCLSQSGQGGIWGEVEDYLINIVNNCANEITLVAPSNNITTGTSLFQTNNAPINTNPGRIIATNKVTGGSTTYSAGKKVELNQGFEVSGGAVFKAEIGGCSN